MFLDLYLKVDEESIWQLERSVVLADCQVLLALLNFLHQELTSMVKGGWVLRKAWKMYDNAYAKLQSMGNETKSKTSMPSKCSFLLQSTFIVCAM